VTTAHIFGVTLVLLLHLQPTHLAVLVHCHVRRVAHRCVHVGVVTGCIECRGVPGTPPSARGAAVNVAPTIQQDVWALL
jgi:hypothetical protein